MTFLDARLVVVTGKGGAGKTTVAGTLAVAGASQGRRTIVCELAATHRIADAFGVVAERGSEVQLAPRLWSASIDPEAALREWLRLQPGGVIAVELLSHSAAFAQFVAAAPGARDVVTIGKLVDFTRRAHAPYDLVVVDGPSTGHALAMLAAPAGVSEVARVGPIGRQAAELHTSLADPAATAYVGVCLPEELAIRELLDLEDGLQRTFGRRLDLIVVNGVLPRWFDDAEAERLEQLAVGGATSLRPVVDEQRRAALETSHIDWLRERTGTPIVTLPFVFESEVDARHYATFARAVMARCASLPASGAPPARAG
jgi:anion-transporting  ArsA/GET3 family ATPase